MKNNRNKLLCTITRVHKRPGHCSFKFTGKLWDVSPVSCCLTLHNRDCDSH